MNNVTEHRKVKVSENSKLFLLLAIFISGVYLFHITDTFLRLIDPACVRDGETTPLLPILFGETYLLKCESMELNEIGDYFAGLLAVLSTFWLVLAFVWQARELSLQRTEFEETNRINEERKEAEFVWHNTQSIFDILPTFRSNCEELAQLEAAINGYEKKQVPRSIKGLVEHVEEMQREGPLTTNEPLRKAQIEKYNNILIETVELVKILKYKIENSYVSTLL